MSTERSNSEAVEMPVSSSTPFSSSSALRTDNSRLEDKKEVVVSIPQTVSSSSSVGVQSSSSYSASTRNDWFGGGTYGFGKSTLLGLGQIPTLNNLRTKDKKGELLPLFPDSVQQGLGLTGDTMTAAYLIVKDKSVAKDIEDRITKVEAEESEFSKFESLSCQPTEMKEFLAQPPRKPQWEDSKIDFTEVKKSTASMVTTSIGVNSATLGVKFLDICCGWCQGYGALAAAFVLAVGHIFTAGRLRIQAVDVENTQEDFHAREKQFLRSKLRYYQQLPTVNDIDAMVQRLVILKDIYAQEEKSLVVLRQQLVAEEKILSAKMVQKDKELGNLNNSLNRLKGVITSQSTNSDEKKHDFVSDIELFKKALSFSTETTNAVTDLDPLYNKAIQEINSLCANTISENKENMRILLVNLQRDYVVFKAAQSNVKDSYIQKIEFKEIGDKQENLVQLYGTEIKSIEKILLEVSKSIQNWQSKIATQLNWNCFDAAIGLADLLEVKEVKHPAREEQAREEIVNRALAKSSDITYRRLLAPEIRHAAALTAIYMDMQQEQAIDSKESKQESKEQHCGRIFELFNIASALTGTNEQQDVFGAVIKELEKMYSKKGTKNTEDLYLSSLPKSMHTSQVQRLVNDYETADETMRPYVIRLNDVLEKKRRRSA